MRSARCENRIGDSRHFDCGLYIVRSQDVHTLKNQGSLSGEISVKPVRGSSVFSIFCQDAAKKRFSRCTCQQGKTERLQFLKASQ